jgi:hypothetical protein
MAAPDKGVRVRMYRQGLGDCFLLAFPREDAKRPFYLLIDCGVILGTAEPGPKMQRVAASIRAATRDAKHPDGGIDLLVATHEHWDHLSGFLQANDVFRTIPVSTLWLGWTEDPGDELANSLRSQRKKTREALHLAMQRFTDAGALGLAGRVAGLLGFFGVHDTDSLEVKKQAGVGDGAETGPGKKAAAKTQGAQKPLGSDTGAALDWLREHADDTRYLRPGGQPLALPGVAGVRVFVLGPPHQDDLIRHSDASAAEKRDRVVYELAGGLGMDMSFFSAMFDPAALTGNTLLADLEAPDLTRPFDVCYRVAPLDAGMPPTANADAYAKPARAKARAACEPNPNAPFFKEFYYGSPGDPPDKDNSWRRIDGEWMEVGAELALKLDSDTNNTSLALAFELKNGDVLLFPADAQVGNWTSWQNYKWKVPDGTGSVSETTARDLLGRTVLYKVGHHGSHNATLRVGGLEWMGTNLVAMVPVDEDVAHDVKHWTHMPLPVLIDALKEKTGGRLMRVDKGLPSDSDRRPNCSLRTWAQFKKATATSNDLFLEYLVELS